MSEDKSIKTFVVDTNVLVHNPEAVMSFKDTEVVIPLWVLEELDGLKISPDYKGRPPATPSASSTRCRGRGTCTRA